LKILCFGYSSYPYIIPIIPFIHLISNLAELQFVFVILYWIMNYFLGRIRIDFSFYFSSVSSDFSSRWSDGNKHDCHLISLLTKIFQYLNTMNECSAFTVLRKELFFGKDEKMELWYNNTKSSTFPKRNFSIFRFIFICKSVVKLICIKIYNIINNITLSVIPSLNNLTISCK